MPAKWAIRKLAAYNYVLQVLRVVMYFNPLRVLMPVGLTLLGVTFVKAVVDLIVHDLRVTGSTVLADLVVRRTATDQHGAPPACRAVEVRRTTMGWALP